MSKPYQLIADVNHRGLWRVLFESDDGPLFQVVSDDLINLCKRLYRSEIQHISAEEDEEPIGSIGYYDIDGSIISFDYKIIFDLFRETTDSILIRRITPSEGMIDSSLILDSHDNFAQPGKAMTT